MGFFSMQIHIVFMYKVKGHFSVTIGNIFIRLGLGLWILKPKILELKHGA